MKIFLHENRFLDIKWEIILDDCSNITQDISQIKVLIKIFYINMTNMQTKEIKIKLIPKEFEVNSFYLLKKYLNFFSDNN